MCSSPVSCVQMQFLGLNVFCVSQCVCVCVFSYCLCVFTPVCSCCYSSDTNISASCYCCYLWMDVLISAQTGHIGGAGCYSSSHIWSCCSLQNRPPAVQRSPPNGPPPPCMNPALTNTSWVREVEGWGIVRSFFSYYPFLLRQHLQTCRIMSCLIVLHVPLSNSFIR